MVKQATLTDGDEAPRRITRRAGRSVCVSLVIPVMNEAENIAWVLERVPDVVDEILIVDGHSTDGTLDVARRVRPDVRVVHERRRGKGAALRAGFNAARGDFILMIDADGSMDPREVEQYLERLHDRRGLRQPDSGAVNYPIVKGSRFLAGGGTDDMGVVRRLGNRALLGLVNVLYGARFTDLCYGLIGFRRDALTGLELRADGFEIETEIVVRALRRGVDIGEVPSFEAPRRSGESNLRTWSDGRRVLRTLLRERAAPLTANGRQGLG